MNRRSPWLPVFCALLAGAISFLVGRSSAAPASQAAARGLSGPAAFARWLDLTPQQQEAVRQADPNYEGDISALKARLQAQRKALAEALANGEEGQDSFTAMVDRVALAHDELERRAARHLMAIRKHLNAEQAGKLLSLAAGEVLHPHQRDDGMHSCCLQGQCTCGKQAPAPAAAERATP